MNDGLDGEVSPWLAPPGGDGLHPWCDKRGAFIGAGMPIVERRLDALGRAHYEPVSLERLNRSLSIGYEQRVDISRRAHGLRAVAKALAAGDIVKAVSALGRVGLPPFPSETAGGSWFKARWDRRWPKGDPEKQGGRFAPKDSEADSAGEIAGPGHNNPPSEIKAEPRPNRWITAHKIARRFARFGATLGGRLPSWGKVAAAIAALSPEIVDHVADIVSYYDEPKTFDELRITKDYREYQSFDALKRDLRPEGSPGYQLHHIVEQNPSNIERFGQGKIQSTENVVEIPTYAHEEISARYNSKNGDSGDMTVREWLSSKPYPFQKEYGLRILKEVGVLR